jgi:hypothetical protein
MDELWYLKHGCYDLQYMFWQVEYKKRSTSLDQWGVEK